MTTANVRRMAEGVRPWHVVASSAVALFASAALGNAADWTWVHGHSGKIQDPNALEPASAECSWVKVEQAGINSHQAGASWCANGFSITAIDLDQQADASALDSPVVGQVLCCRNKVTPFEIGWGLDFTLANMKTTWLHFTVPVAVAESGAAQKKVRYVKLRFWTGSAAATVFAVNVYNGENKVWGTAASQKWSNGLFEPALDLSTAMTFDRGLGISVGIKAATDPDSSGSSRRFKFYSVAAKAE